jgi:hypothetical protein
VQRSTPTSSAAATRPRAKAVPRKARPKPTAKRPKPTAKREAALPKVEIPETTRASVDFLPRAKVAQSGSFDIVSLLIISGLALAIACFAVAVIPAASVPWRPAAIFVSERHVDMTVIGFVLLLAAAFTFFLSQGS